MSKDPTITCFLIKIASRCNLNCDYCYVFNHVDQTWKTLPPLMKKNTQENVVKRIAEYAHMRSLKNCLIIFHGGEPLLLGSDKICQMVDDIRAQVKNTAVDFSLQTNGVLLKEADIKLFEKYSVGISLSIDGPKIVNDLHRVTHKTKSSFDETFRAYNFLKKYPEVFTGVLSVIDVRASAREILEFFNEIDPPNLDFLLPDAHYDLLPPFRTETPDVYKVWLLEAFDLWFDHYPHLKVRLFDSLLASLMGTQSGTDFFGLGDVTLLSIETDGSYHDLDVLKITSHGNTSLGMNVDTHSIYEASLSERVQSHRLLLKREGLSKTCQQCSVVEICGGGSVPHRFSQKNGFDNPTIYCREMLSLIEHAQLKLSEVLDKSLEQKPKKIHINENHFDVIAYNQSNINSKEFASVYSNWCEKIVDNLTNALQNTLLSIPLNEAAQSLLQLSKEDLKLVAKLPSVQLWSHVINKKNQGIEFYDLDENPISVDRGYADKIWEKINDKKALSSISIHENDPWLRLLFGKKIIFEAEDISDLGKKLIEEALHIIKMYDPSLVEEIKLISPIVQFIQDPTAHPDKLVSFSDDVVPGALYICIRVNNALASPYDIAESIIHEHRHQKLYLLENYFSVVESDFPYVKSPWREELRPASGLFHAVFVFSEIEKYWSFVAAQYPNVSKKALSEVETNRRMLQEGIETLLTCPLTHTGKQLLYHFLG